MNGEDLLADAVFGSGYPVGRYVDVGCFDPRKWSNTYGFYLKGWSGLCIDPNPQFKSEWKRLRPRDTFINVAVSTTRGQAAYLTRFGLPHENRIETEADPPPEGWTVGAAIATDRLDALLGEYKFGDHPLDLMNIDCEGHDLQVLHSNDFTCFRPRVLIVEDHSKLLPSEIDEFCQSVDYRLVGRILFSKVFVDARWFAEKWKPSQETGSHGAKLAS